jgi:hypothetical protein
VLVSPLPVKPSYAKDPLALILAKALGESLNMKVGPTLIVGGVARIEVPNRSVETRALALKTFYCLGYKLTIEANSDRILENPQVLLHEEASRHGRFHREAAGAPGADMSAMGAGAGGPEHPHHGGGHPFRGEVPGKLSKLERMEKLANVRRSLQTGVHADEDARAAHTAMTSMIAAAKRMREQGPLAATAAGEESAEAAAAAAPAGPTTAPLTAEGAAVAEGDAGVAPLAPAAVGEGAVTMAPLAGAPPMVPHMAPGAPFDPVQAHAWAAAQQVPMLPMMADPMAAMAGGPIGAEFAVPPPMTVGDGGFAVPMPPGMPLDPSMAYAMAQGGPMYPGAPGMPPPPMHHYPPRHYRGGPPGGGMDGGDGGAPPVQRPRAFGDRGAGMGNLGAPAAGDRTRMPRMRPKRSVAVASSEEEDD